MSFKTRNMDLGWQWQAPAENPRMGYPSGHKPAKEASQENIKACLECQVPGGCKEYSGLCGLKKAIRADRQLIAFELVDKRMMEILSTGEVIKLEQLADGCSGMAGGSLTRVKMSVRRLLRKNLIRRVRRGFYQKIQPSGCETGGADPG